MPGTAILTIDRPDRRNALDLATCRRLTAELEAAAELGARAVVLTGAGAHFCAGADLSLVHGAEFGAALRRLLEAITETTVPVIAAVRGAALGAGTQLAIACDLRVVEPTARFGIPAAKLGLMVDQWTVARLSQVAGHATAQAMLLAAAEIDADAALRLGFAQRGGDLQGARDWAEEIAALAPLTLKGHKAMLNGATDTTAYQAAWASHDAQEGLAAFRERRRPQFEGR